MILSSCFSSIPSSYAAPFDPPRHDHRVFASELKEVVEVEQDADGNPDANGFGPWDREIITTSPRMPKDLMEGLIIPWPTEKGCGFGERACPLFPPAVD
jgi:hypothetical protein